ncbi:hypothetical protein [uncultured Alcanivorax sp.]|uniref:hypothetical protein n=1 Tax=uncultured Alcanivorax sp. TaxID=191215 RepID=UPI002611C801|nr:hypothetical protein [uncultured Alcanivorax sp.]
MKKVFLITAALGISSVSLAAEFPDVALTKEQCEDWNTTEYISLTKENKELVEDSCKERYSSEHALGNCTAFEGQDLIDQLKKQAKSQCK